MNNKILLLLSISILSLSGCMSSKEKRLLPDAGATTTELVTGQHNAENNYYGSRSVADYLGQPIATGYQPMSSYSETHVQELQRDFKRVPNPDIVGYVYPHINNNEMPVPGYFTMFKLYERDHFALTSEGHHVR